MVVDIHSHMLPDVDDGAENIEITKAMIKMSYEEGCKSIIFTPHADALNYPELNVKEKYEVIDAWISDTYTDMKVYLGSEIYADSNGIEDINTIIYKLNKGIYLTLNNTKYVLVEFYLGGVELKEIIPSVKALQDAGYIPVIAHVERYGLSVEDIKKLKKMGCMIQINIGNVFNPSRISAMVVANKLIRDRIVDFVGTDSHGIDWRPPIIKRYTDYMYNMELVNLDYIDAILYKNAQKYLNIE